MRPINATDSMPSTMARCPVTADRLPCLTQRLLLCLALLGPMAGATDLPFALERFSLPGPMAGVLVKVRLDDPRTQLEVALADDAPAGADTDCRTRLDTVSSIAKKRDYDITLNAGFFAVPVPRRVEGRDFPYAVGNCAQPVGWHFSDGKLVSQPVKAALRATLIVHVDGRVALADNVQALPADTRFAVSGSALVLADGIVTAPGQAGVRHPRSAVGLSADGKTLLLVAVDGRQAGHSRGATLGELGALLLGFGAQHALNLDGGGSTTLVLKDPAIGTYSLVNRPSDLSTLGLSVANERPVADVIGIRFRP